MTDDRVAQFITDETGERFVPPYTCMGIERDGKIVAGVVFNGYTGPAIEINVAGTGWDRGFMREVGRYVFGQLGCSRMGMTTEKDYVARLAMRLGARHEGTLCNQFGPGRDGQVYGCTKEEYRF